MQKQKNTRSCEISEQRYLAHIDKATSREQYLYNHLENVAERSARFAAAFGEEAVGRALGRYHDIGKYSNEFQDYIRAPKEEQQKKRGTSDHWTAGGKEMTQMGAAGGGASSRHPESRNEGGHCGKAYPHRTAEEGGTGLPYLP